MRDIDGLRQRLLYLESEHERMKMSDDRYYSNGGYNRDYAEIYALKKQIRELENDRD